MVEQDKSYLRCESRYGDEAFLILDAGVTTCVRYRSVCLPYLKWPHAEGRPGALKQAVGSDILLCNVAREFCASKKILSLLHFPLLSVGVHLMADRRETRHGGSWHVGRYPKVSLATPSLS